MNKPSIQGFFDPNTSTVTYVVFDEATRDAVIIDPVWDYDQRASKLGTESLKKIVDFVSEKKLVPHFALETHVHADHVTASQLLKNHFPQIKVAIGRHITVVQKVFGKLFHLDADFHTDGRQFDLLLDENAELKAGSLSIKIIFTPGHTPACSSYLIGDALFTGDALFMPDYGTGRCDFPGGSAETLYASIHTKLYALPDATRVFVGHDYAPGGRKVLWESTLGEEKNTNIHLKQTTARDDFVSFRKNRDAGLSAPNLLLPSIQINMRAGYLPEPESNGTRYLKIPIQEV